MRISKTAIALAVTAAIPALSLVGSSDVKAASKLAIGKAADPRQAQPHFKYPVHARAAVSTVLYDQTGTVVNGAPSQNFESAIDQYDAQGADDFVVTDAAGWTLSAFNFVVSATSDPSSATYDINVLPDNGGLPGASPVCSYPAAAGVLTSGNTALSVALPSPCVLSQGTYWIEMVVNLDFGVGGQVFWSDYSPGGTGANSKWQNPGGGFGTACSTWSDLSTCVGSTSPVGGGQTAFMFQVVGTVGGGGGTCGAGSLCLVSTVGTDTSPGACGAADTIDATVGDQLNFCYTVTNNSGVDLDYQSLANNVDGDLLTFAHQAIAPGASYQYNHIETVANTLTYTSSWTAYDVLPGYAAEVESGGGCGDRIFADGFGDAPSGCGAFVEISGTGTPLGLGDDDSADVTMPFSFNFYGATSNVLSVSNNGGILFGAPGALLDFSNASLPAASFPAPAILPLWDDFDSSSGDVYFDTRGSAPNRQFIVEWYQRAHFSGNTDTATFEVIFNEADGTLQFEYADVAYTAANSFTPDPPICDDGVCATIGLQGSTSIYNQFSAFNAAVIDNSGIKWTATSAQIFTSTDSVTVNVGEPDINVMPPSITTSVPAGGTTSALMDIQNLGNRDLNWTANEAPPVNLHFPYGPRYAPSTVHAGETDISALRPSVAWLGAHGHAYPVKKGTTRAHPTAPLATTPSFGCNIISSSCEYVSLDAEAPAALTDIASENELMFGATFVNNDFSKEYVVGYPSGDLETIDTATGVRTTIGATGQGNAVRDLAFDAMSGTTFGTAINAPGTDLFTVDTATGAMTLIGPITGLGAQAYVMGLAVDPGTGLMYGIEIVSSALVAIDKNTGAASTIGTLGYTARFSQGLDFDAATHTLYLASIDYDASTQNMYTVDLATGEASIVGPTGVNQLSAFGIAVPAGPCTQPADQPWLSINPTTGMTPGGFDTPTTVTIDATNANAGDTLSGTVCVRSNDPDEPVVEVPVSVDVTIPPPPPVPPTVTKSFNPAQVTPGTTSTLTITLANANAADAMLIAQLVDAFPNGLMIAGTPNAQTTCGGSVTAGAGTTAVALDAAGSMIPANGSCTVTVDVVSVSPNDYANDIPVGALQTSEGANTVSADATLSVAFVAPTLTKAFAPGLITLGSTSTLVITLGNPNGIDTTLTSSLLDAFPPGLVVDALPNATTTCANGSVTAAGGDVSVSLDGPAVIPAGGTCTVTIDVTAAVVGDYANSIPADSLHTFAGANAISADATLKVTP